MTAADLLAAEKRFATGYIFGAIEYQVGIPVNDNFAKRREEIRKCLLDGKFMSDALYTKVTTFIRRHPGTLPNSAIGAILQAVNDICPEAGR
ncbi:hypothetical protein [Phyllobacterium zundukense]|nr:hypothetical protein [Phyllobacterium zundukense]